MANPNPVPACCGSLATQLHEGKEDALAILLADAGPGILNLKSHPCPFGIILAGEPGPELHPARVCIFNGVANQIQQHLAQLARVHGHKPGQIWIVLQGETETLFHGPYSHQRLDFAQQSRQINLGLLQDHPDRTQSSPCRGHC